MKYFSLGLGLVLFLVLLVIAFGAIKKEGFSNAATTAGPYPSSVDRVILDTYPQKGSNQTSTENYSQIWWHQPVFSLGSFEQITNNLRYLYNPDQGTCVRADFCGAMYDDDENTKSNIVLPMPPAEEGAGARVGYFRTEPNKLFWSIPTNENILY